MPMAAGQPDQRPPHGGLARPPSMGALATDALAHVSAHVRRSSDSLAALAKREEERLKAALSQAADDLRAERDRLGAAVVSAALAVAPPPPPALSARPRGAGAKAAALQHRPRRSASAGSLDWAWPSVLGGGRGAPTPPDTLTAPGGRAAKARRRLGGALTAAPRLLRSTARAGVGRVRRGGRAASASSSSTPSMPRLEDGLADLFAALERGMGGGGLDGRGRTSAAATTATRILAGPAAAARAAGAALEEAQLTVSDNLATLGAALARGAGAAAAALPGADAGWDQASSASASAGASWTASSMPPVVGGALASAVTAESALLPPPLPPGVWRPGGRGGVWRALLAAAGGGGGGGTPSPLLLPPPPPLPAPDALLAELPAPLAAAFRALTAPKAGERPRTAAERAADAAAAAAAAAAPKPRGPLQAEAARRRAAAAASARAGVSTLRDPARKVAIFTTAALPWMTGTAVNPLLRAAYLAAQDPRREVTLYVPWLAPADQAVVYPARHRFASPAAQAAYVRSWARERTGLPCNFRLEFYPGRYAPEKGSILPVGDLTARVPASSADVAVLEEPEHLTWYHHGARWADRFAHVVGVVHTNYLDYAAREEGGALKAAALRAVNEIVCRVHCHKVVKLSDAVQRLPRETTQFVHGVPGAFLDVGRARAAALAKCAAERGQGGGGKQGGGAGGAPAAAATPTPPGSGPASAAFTKGAYFIGKAIWAKGYTELLDLVEQDSGGGGRGGGAKAGGGGGRGASAAAPGEHGWLGAALARVGGRPAPPPPPAAEGPQPPPPPPLHVDCFGAGDDLPALKAAAASRGLPLTFHGGRDHLDPGMHGYRVLVNPSTSDVVATTTAEALAMGKWVLVADLPCNAFFASRFRNCLTYRSPREFSARLRHALATDPHPLSDEEAAALSWEAATQRFLDATELTPAERPSGAEAAADRALGAAFNALTGVEPLRELAGAGPGTRDAPPSLDGWEPKASGGGGFFDNKDRLATGEAKRAAAAAAAAAAGGGGGGGGEKGGRRRGKAALAAAA